VRFEELKKHLKGLELIGKGWRSYVYRALYGDKEVAIKVAKDKHLQEAIRKEADILQRLKGIESFPQILMKGEDFFMYEFIKGTPFEKCTLDETEKIKIFLRILELAYFLDSMCISKDEFQKLDKNLLIGEDGHVYLIDFERGKISCRRKTNLPQLIQLFVREGYLPIHKAIELGRSYKENPEGVFHELQKVLTTRLPNPS
jgi:putative serine/threonine protein kinase